MYTFDYQRPSSTAAAASSHQGDTRYLAGGQSLVQAMKLRLSSSERLVDLGGVETLKGIRVDGANVVIGAMTTHAAVAISSEVRRAIPALADLAALAPQTTEKTREATDAPCRTVPRPTPRFGCQNALDATRPRGTAFATSPPPRGLHAMIIDRETFTELAVHLKLASDAILKTARHLTVLSNGDSSNEEQWAGTLDSLTAMNTEITVMEKILRALMEANREEESPSLMVPDKQSEPLLS